MNSRENPSSLLLLRLKPWFSKNRNLSLSGQKRLEIRATEKCNMSQAIARRRWREGSYLSRLLCHVARELVSTCITSRDLGPFTCQISRKVRGKVCPCGSGFIAGFRKCHLDFSEISKFPLSSRSWIRDIYWLFVRFFSFFFFWHFENLEACACRRCLWHTWGERDLQCLIMWATLVDFGDLS